MPRTPRTTTALRFEPEMHDRLAKAADAFGLPMNFLVNYAVREFLDHMIDPAEFRLTRLFGEKGAVADGDG